MASLALGGPQTSFQDEALTTLLAYAQVADRPARRRCAAPQATRDVVFWAQGLGAWGRFNGDGNAVSVRRDLAGFFTGVDTRVGANGRAGVAAGYTGSKNVLDGRGSANVDTGHVAAYGGWSFGALNLRAGGGYAFHTIDTDRTINFAGFFDRTFAHYQGGTGQVFGEARLRLQFRQRGGRAVRRRRLGAAVDRRGRRARRAGGAQRRRHDIRGRLLDARHPRRQHRAARRQHDAGAARRARLAARVRQRDAGGNAGVSGRAGAVRDLRRSDRA